MVVARGIECEVCKRGGDGDGKSYTRNVQVALYLPKFASQFPLPLVSI